MGAEDLCEAKVKRAKTIVGLEICVLEAQDEVYDAPGTPTNPAETSGEKATDEDVVAPELGRAHKAPSVDELTPLRHVYSQKTNERLDDRKVAEGRQLTVLHVFKKATQQQNCACPKPYAACRWQHPSMTVELREKLLQPMPVRLRRHYLEVVICRSMCTCVARPWT